ncbi:sigma-70 family RNA polymerase sigma factor [Verrucomicrobium sp. BvORR106]|uniref:sigma-70 family RNA polymerase sigma factor n=1 Tax=Verrucomicrobium sp. BvORR106 TaxID=1403819 RepID=UPI00068C6B91|nr:sigma-70 family RNA polymerase sigma factor [Verrucomicrobium sp. BvORR106]
MKGVDDTTGAGAALLDLPAGFDFKHRSFDEELAEHAMSIRLYVRSLMPGYEGADDIAQETLLKIWQKRADFTPGSNFKAWAFQIARYLVLNQRRRLANSKVTLLDDELLNRIDQHWREEPAPQMDEEMAALASCMSQLSPEDRQLLQARYFSRTPLKDHATALGIRLSTLRARLFRLRVALARDIEERLAGASVRQ